MATDDELEQPVAAAADWLERVAGVERPDGELVPDGEEVDGEVVDDETDEADEVEDLPEPRQVVEDLSRIHIPEPTRPY